MRCFLPMLSHFYPPGAPSGNCCCGGPAAPTRCSWPCVRDQMEGNGRWYLGTHSRYLGLPGYPSIVGIMDLFDYSVDGTAAWEKAGRLSFCPRG